MWGRTARLMATAILLGLSMAAQVEGGPITTPAGLSPGDEFRVVFVTDGTTTATSANIADYNTFVNAQAAGATYNGQLVTWDAIGSTESTSAITNVGQTDTPVYLSDGTLVTSNTGATGLWSGSLSHSIDEDLSGSTTLQAFVWTGTESNGNHDPGNSLGDFFSSLYGATARSDAGWTSFSTLSPSNQFALYGISQVLVVPQAVPEPSGLILLGTALGAGVLIVPVPRRRDRNGKSSKLPSTPTTSRQADEV